MDAPNLANTGIIPSARGLRRFAVLFAGLCLLAGSAAAGSPAGGGGKADAPGSKAPASRCLDETDVGKLLNRTGHSQHRSLLTTTDTLGAGTHSKIVLLGPLGVDNVADLFFKAFYVVPQSKTPVGGDARLLATSLSPDDLAKIAKRISINPTGNYLLQLDVPSEANPGFDWQRVKLIVIACRADGANPLLWADTGIDLASANTPIIVGIATVLALYLFCCGVVFLSRRRLIAKAKEAQDKTTGKPRKLSPDPPPAFILWWLLRLFGRPDIYAYLMASDGKAAAQAADGTGKATPIYRTADVTLWPWYKYFDPVAISSDLFDRGSLSNLQILFFSLLVCYGLTYIVLSTGEISSISSTVVALLGVTGFGSVTAKAIGTSRNRLSAQNWSWLVSRKVLPINDPGKNIPRWSDLVMAESELNLYKLQALAFSVIVGLGLIMGGFELATFTVPQELLEILLSSQLIFVAGGLAAPAAVGELDKLLDELRAREDALRTAAATGKDVDSAGVPTDKPADGKPVATFAEARHTVRNAANRYLQTADQAKIMLQSIAHRDVNSTFLENPPLGNNVPG